MKRSENGYLSTVRTVLILLNYFVGYYWAYPYLVSWLIKDRQVSEHSLVIYMLVIYGWVFVTTVLLAYPAIEYGFKNLFKHLGQQLKLILLSAAGMIVVNVGISLLLNAITGQENSANEQNIRQMYDIMPQLVVALSCIFAPVVEEIVFRLCIMGPLRRKGKVIWGIVVSSFFFGLAHVSESITAGNYADLIYIFVYSGIGVVLAIAYHKGDSIITSMLVHAINNSLGMLALGALLA